MNQEQITLIVSFIIIMLLFFYGGVRFWNLRRMVRDVPTSKIRSIAMGLVEIFGKIVPVPSTALTSPFTQKKCVYYSYIIEECHAGKNSRWVKKLSDKQFVPFYLQDATGKVLIDPTNAQIEVPTSYVAQSGFGTDPDASVKAFLKKEGVSFEKLFGINKKMRFREYSIYTGDNIYILGTAQKNMQTAVGTALKNTDNIVIAKKGRGSIFYISNKTEEGLVKRLGIQALSCFAGGIIFGIMTLVI